MSATRDRGHVREARSLFRARPFAMLPLLALVGACASPPGVPVGAGADPDTIELETTLAAPPAAAEAKAAQVLEDLGFAPLADRPSAFRAEFDRTSAWAYCPVLTTRLSEKIEHMRARSGVVDLDLTVAPAGTSSHVAIGPTFTGVYPRPDGAGTFEHPCASFGVVEQAFFERLRGP